MLTNQPISVTLVNNEDVGEFYNSKFIPLALCLFIFIIILCWIFHNFNSKKIEIKNESDVKSVGCESDTESNVESIVIDDESSYKKYTISLSGDGFDMKDFFLRLSDHKLKGLNEINVFYDLQNHVVIIDKYKIPMDWLLNAQEIVEFEKSISDVLIKELLHKIFNKIFGAFAGFMIRQYKNKENIIIKRNIVIYNVHEIKIDDILKWLKLFDCPVEFLNFENYKKIEGDEFGGERKKLVERYPTDINEIVRGDFTHIDSKLFDLLNSMDTKILEFLCALGGLASIEQSAFIEDQYKMKIQSGDTECEDLSVYFGSNVIDVIEINGDELGDAWFDFKFNDYDVLTYVVSDFLMAKLKGRLFGHKRYVITPRAGPDTAYDDHSLYIDHYNRFLLKYFNIIRDLYDSGNGHALEKIKYIFDKINIDDFKIDVKVLDEKIRMDPSLLRKTDLKNNNDKIRIVMSELTQQILCDRLIVPDVRKIKVDLKLSTEYDEKNKLYKCTLLYFYPKLDGNLDDRNLAPNSHFKYGPDHCYCLKPSERIEFQYNGDQTLIINEFNIDLALILDKTQLMSMKNGFRDGSLHQDDKGVSDILQRIFKFIYHIFLDVVQVSLEDKACFVRLGDRCNMDIFMKLLENIDAVKLSSIANARFLIETSSNDKVKISNSDLREIICKMDMMLFKLLCILNPYASMEEIIYIEKSVNRDYYDKSQYFIMFFDPDCDNSSILPISSQIDYLNDYNRKYSRLYDKLIVESASKK